MIASIVIVIPNVRSFHIASMFVWNPTKKKKNGTRNPNAIVWIECVISVFSHGLCPGSLISACLMITPLNSAPISAPIPSCSASVAITRVIISAPVNSCACSGCPSIRCSINGITHILNAITSIAKSIVPVANCRSVVCCTVVCRKVSTPVIRNSSTMSSRVPALTISIPSFVFSLLNSSSRSSAIAVALTLMQTPTIRLVPVSSPNIYLLAA